MKVVVAAGIGTLTDEEVFGYHREVWSRKEVAGYDELIDMSRVGHIALPSAQRVRDLAETSAKDDGPGPSRLAVVAPSDLAFGLGRMYQTRRAQDPRSTKQVGVFRTMAEALEFLRMDHAPEPPDLEGALPA